MNLIFLGAPGSGKGTQAEFVSEKMNIPPISTGNMLREAVRNGTAAGLEAKAFMDAGDLVPDEVVIGIIKDRIAEDDCKSGFILDGFPRSVKQAEALESMGVKIDLVVEIDVPDDRIIARMGGRRVCDKCGASYHIEYKPTDVEGKCNSCDGDAVQRVDDAPETVVSRLKTYHEITAPLLDFYGKSGKLKTVVGQIEIADTKRLTFEAIGCQEEA
jgi:adenylate kinase